MSSHNSKVIAKINRDTKEGLIIWEINRSNPSSINGIESLLDNVYTSKVLDRNLRLYKYKTKYFHDEDTFDWTEGYRLEFIDKWGNSEWTFPENRATYDLYETVRYKTSKIDDFMDKYLDDEEKKDDEENFLF